MLIISCPPGLAQITKKELQFLGFKSQILGPATLSVPHHTEADIATLNIRLRTANKVSLIVDSGQTHSFDELFDLIHDQPRHKIIGSEQAIIVEATSFQSQLTSLPAIQKIAKKAIIKKLLQGKSGLWNEQPSKGTIIVNITIQQNHTIIALNSSGESLHRRGYRTTTGDAPIKETIAAALIISSGRKFHEPFLDPCCGSWTFAIEAAMIAKNIAPWLQRSFAFENRVWYPKEYLVQAITHAKSRRIDKQHHIFASDIDDTMISKAKENANRLSLQEAIKRSTKPCQRYLQNIPTNTTIISNPPYWIRMKPTDIHTIHQALATLIGQPNNRGGFVTGYDQSQSALHHPNTRTTLTLKNGSESVYFWKKKEKAQL